MKTQTITIIILLAIACILAKAEPRKEILIQLKPIEGEQVELLRLSIEAYREDY